MKIPRMHRFPVSFRSVDEKRRLEVQLSKLTKIDRAYVASRALREDVRRRDHVPISGEAEVQ